MEASKCPFHTSRTHSILLRELKRNRTKLEERQTLLIRDLSRGGRLRNSKKQTCMSLERKDSGEETVLNSPYIQVIAKESSDASIGTDFEWRPDSVPRIPTIEMSKLIPCKPATSLSQHHVSKLPRRFIVGYSHTSKSLLSVQHTERRKNSSVAAERLQALCLQKQADIIRTSRNKSEYQAKAAIEKGRYMTRFRRRKFVSLSEANLCEDSSEDLSLIGQRAR